MVKQTMSDSEKKLDYETLLKEIEVARLRLREAGVEADRYKEKFELAVSNAHKRELEILGENETLAHKLCESDMNLQALNQKCILLEDQLKIEREKFFKQESELIDINKVNRNRAGEERRAKLDFEQKLDVERTERESVIKELQATQDKIAASETERRYLEHEISVLKSTYEKALNKEKESAKTFKTNAQKEKSNAESFLKEVRDSRAIIDDLQEKLGSEIKDKSSLETKLESALTKIQRLEQDSTETQERLMLEQQKTQEEAHNYQGKLLEARHDFSELEVRYERLLRRQSRAKFEYRRDRTELLGEYRHLEKDKNLLNLKLRETEKQMNVEKRVAGNQIDQLRAQMRNALSSAEREKQDLSRQLDVLLKDAEDVRRRSEGFDVEVSEIRESYEEKIKNVEKEFNRVSDALQKTAKAFEDESRRNEKLNEQAVNMRKLLEELEKRMRDGQAENQSILKANKKKYDNLYEDHENIKRLLLDAIDEKKRSDIKLDEAKAQEGSLRTTVKGLKNEIELMQESVSASSASKAYLKEKYEAIDIALEEVRGLLKSEQKLRNKAEEKLKLERESFRSVEKQLRTSIIAERDQLESEHSREVGSYREEIDTLVKERDIARGDLGEERARNQELLQNLLTMREELELTQEASAAAKVFLKDKLAKAEEQLEEYRSEFLLEEQRRQELEKQLRELRRKMEFA